MDKLKTELNESGCYPGVCRQYSNSNKQKIPEHCLRASKVGLGCGIRLVWNNSVVYQPTKDGDITIQQKEGFKRPKDKSSVDKHCS